MINFYPNSSPELKPRITVIGVGGAGGNAVNNMILSNLEGVEFIVANTDSQAMSQSRTDRRIQMGGGLGAGAKPEVGRAAAEEAMEKLVSEIQGSNMVFIAAGMGGGTGTGAAPVIARAAREQGILTVGVVTKPFHFEGPHRMRQAEAGIAELTNWVDTLMIIPNQNLFRVASQQTTFADAFKMADDVLYSGVRGVTDLMVMPGLINLDFSDIRSVMSEMGKAMMGTGQAGGEGRGNKAAEAAINNPLLEDISVKGARGILVNITGGADLTLFDVDEAMDRIRTEVDHDANIIFGSTFDDTLVGEMRVSVVATGIDVASSPVSISKQPEDETETIKENPIPQNTSQRDDPRKNIVAQEKTEPLLLNEVIVQSNNFDAPDEKTDQSSLGVKIAEVGDAVRALVDTPEVTTAPEPPPPAKVQSSEPPPPPTPPRQSFLDRLKGVARPAAATTKLLNQFQAPNTETPPPPSQPKVSGSHQLEQEGASSLSSPTDASLLEVPAFLRRRSN